MQLPLLCLALALSEHEKDIEGLAQIVETPGFHPDCQKAWGSTDFKQVPGLAFYAHYVPEETKCANWDVKTCPNMRERHSGPDGGGQVYFSSCELLPWEGGCVRKAERYTCPDTNCRLMATFNSANLRNDAMACKDLTKYNSSALCESTRSIANINPQQLVGAIMRESEFASDSFLQTYNDWSSPKHEDQKWDAQGNPYYTILSQPPCMHAYLLSVQTSTLARPPSPLEFADGKGGNAPRTITSSRSNAMTAGTSRARFQKWKAKTRPSTLMRFNKSKKNASATSKPDTVGAKKCLTGRD